MVYKVERDWITEAGLRAVVIMGTLGFRCGYVGIEQSHPLYGVEYTDTSESLDGSPESVLDVHGGVTYSDGGKDGEYPLKSDLWWFGYDCGHLGDGRSPEYIALERERWPDEPFMWGENEGEFRSLEYCVGECEALAKQLAEIQ